MHSFLFYLLATVVIVSALVMVTRRHPLPAAFALVICFIGLAGLYGLLSAPLIAILQVLVYAGAIMALVVFVIMLLNVRDEDLPPEPNLYASVGLALAVGAVFFFGVAAPAINRFPGSGLGPDVPVGYGGINAVGLHLYNHFGFPFELVSLLLTAAVVGVVVLAKRRI